MTCGSGVVTQLQLYGSSPSLTGDIGQLAALTQLTDLRLYNTGVSGCPLRLANGKSCDCSYECE